MADFANFASKLLSKPERLAPAMKSALKATVVSAMLTQQHGALLAKQKAELEVLNAQFLALDAVFDRMDKVTAEDKAGPRIRVADSRHDYRYRHWPKTSDPVPRALKDRKAKNGDYKQVSACKLSLTRPDPRPHKLPARIPRACVRCSCAADIAGV